MRISVQLVEAKTDRQLWAKEFDYEIKVVLSLQNEAARAIVEEIGVKLTGKPQGRLELHAARQQPRFGIDVHAANR